MKIQVMGGEGVDHWNFIECTGGDGLRVVSGN